MRDPPESWGGLDPSFDPSLNGWPLTWLSDVEPIEPKFVEYPLLQAAMMHLVAGKPGVGKGALCARWIARCTNGEMYGEPRRALWLSSEEDAARDLRPRLDVAGADVSRVALIPDQFQLPRDVEWLQERIEKEGEIGLVVIDPISNHIQRTNSSMEEEVREALQPLARLADVLDIVMLVIRHVSTKEGRGNFLGRVLGATGFVGVARAVIGVAQDHDGFVHVRTLKGNRVPQTDAGRCFRLESVAYREWGATVVRAAAAGPSEIDFEDLLSMVNRQAIGSESERARQMILDTLREHGGRMLTDILDATIVEQTGLARKTVRNLRQEMYERVWLSYFPEEVLGVKKWHVALTNAAPWNLEVSTTEEDLFSSPSPASGETARARVHPTGTGLDETSPVQEQFSTDSLPDDSIMEEPDRTGSKPAETCPTCGSTRIGPISGRCHDCGERVHPNTLDQ
jgi:hypothetical protein